MLIRIHVSHLGAETCLPKARDAIYWPTINFEGEDFISNLLHTMITCKATAKQQQRTTD